MPRLGYRQALGSGLALAVAVAQRLGGPTEPASASLGFAQVAVGARVRHPIRTPDSKFVPPHTTHNFSL